MDATSVEQLLAAIPSTVHTAMRQSIPSKYTPALADAIAADIVERLHPQAAVIAKCRAIALDEPNPVRRTRWLIALNEASRLLAENGGDDQ